MSRKQNSSLSNYGKIHSPGAHISSAKRSDHLTHQARDKADFSHDYENMRALKTELEKLNKRGSKHQKTFGVADKDSYKQ